VSEAMKVDDKVKVVRGDFKGYSGVVTAVGLLNVIIIVEGQYEFIVDKDDCEVVP
jgi:ribosomal protein L24